MWGDVREDGREAHGDNGVGGGRIGGPKRVSGSDGSEAKGGASHVVASEGCAQEVGTSSGGR